jgi:hypothetical protein
MTRLLTTAVILLFLAVSTNAFACLVPLYGASNMGLETGCPSADEKSPREFCDLFKSGVPAYSSHHPIPMTQIVLSAFEPDSLPLFNKVVEPNRYHTYSADKLSQDIFLKTTILRI